MSFPSELKELVKKYDLGENSNTPDEVLVQYILDCLSAYNLATSKSKLGN